MKTGRTAVAVAGFLALLASPALAATLRVPQDHATIQDAANAAVDGDTILVSKGVYREQVTIAGKNNLRFLGKGAVWSTNEAGVEGHALQATGNGIVVQGFDFLHGGGQVRITGDDAVVTKCTSQGGEWDDNEFSFLRVDGNGATVQKCRVRDAAEPAVHVFGNGANVSKNQFGFMRDIGVVVEGDAAVVEKNRFESCHVMAVSVEGSDAVVTRNKIMYARVIAVHVFGDGRVEKNQVLGGAGVAGICVDNTNAAASEIVSNKVREVIGTGIRCEADSRDGVDGAGSEVIGNKVDYPGHDGLQVESNDATVSSNKIRFAGRRGIFLRSDDAVVSSNQVKGSGNGCLAAFEVHGNDNDLNGNKAIKHAGDGFHVDGDDNTLSGCLAKGCTEDGFDMQGGSNNELTNCTGAKNGAEGLDNTATNTDVSGSSFSKNRLDVTNDGTFANLGASFSTGGDSTPPEVDCDDGQRGNRW